MTKIKRLTTANVGKDTEAPERSYVAGQCIKIYNYIGQAMSWQLLDLGDGYMHIHYSTLSTLVYI